MGSPAAKLRDAIAARVTALRVGSGPRFKRVQKDPLPQFQPGDMPAAAVYIQSETLTPDGDGNAGELHFVTDTIIAIVVARRLGTVEVLSGKLDEDADLILATLFTDPDFTTLDAEKALFESVERIERVRLFPQEGDAYTGDLKIAITFRARADFETVVKDDYRGATVTVRPLQNPDAPPIVAHWDEPAEG